MIANMFLQIDGKTPLILAAENGNLEIVSILLKKRALPNETEVCQNNSFIGFA